jgi:hypothetical protein
MKTKLFFATILLIFGCKSVPKGQQITVGSGGGITGIWNEYTLQPDGQISVKNSKVDTLQKVVKLSKSDTKMIFKKASELKLDTLKLDSPGNMSYFVKFSDKDKFDYKVLWGGEKTPPDSVKKFYKDFMGFVSHE